MLLTIKFDERSVGGTGWSYDRDWPCLPRVGDVIRLRRLSPETGNEMKPALYRVKEIEHDFVEGNVLVWVIDSRKQTYETR
jgi:hypothetical protein